MFRKSIQFTAKVSDFTDGTVTAQIQAENDIVNQLAIWLQAQMPSLTQLEKISIGDSAWSGYPMYADNSGAPTTATTYINDSTAYKVLTDVFIFGKSTDNWVCGLAADKHVLRFAPTCSFTKQAALNAVTSRPLSIPLCALRQHRYATNRIYRLGSLDLFTFPTNQDELVLELDYWRGASSLVLSARGGLDFVFFTEQTQATAAGFGLKHDSTSNGHCGFWDFEETMQASDVTQTATSASALSTQECLAYNYATSYNPYYWGNFNSPSGPYSGASLTEALPVSLHHLQPEQAAVFSDITANHIAPTTERMGFPRVNSDELYLRRVAAPNTRADTVIKLAYTPGRLYARSVYTAGGKNYLNLADGWGSFMIEVADQGD